MPRIHDDLLETVFFLYRDCEAARRGENSGGTGFLAAVPWGEESSAHHIYAVTNRHLITSDTGYSVIRLNRKDGEPEIFDADVTDWQPDPTGHDISVRLLSPDYNTVAYSAVTVHAKNDFCFIDDNIILDYSIGIGDEVFSPGRLIDVAGVQRNRPVVQFGCVSLMPPEIIQGEDSLLVELRSRTGFSGSPVFVFIPPTTETMRPASRKKMQAQEMYGPWLLGMRWGQYPTSDQLSDEKKQKEIAKYASGMVMVVPAQRIADFLLTNKKLLQQRQIIEDQARDSGINDVWRESESEPPTTADNPSHAEDFNRLLTSVTTRKPQGDQT